MTELNNSLKTLIALRNLKFIIIRQNRQGTTFNNVVLAITSIGEHKIVVFSSLEKAKNFLLTSRIKFLKPQIYVLMTKKVETIDFKDISTIKPRTKKLGGRYFTTLNLKETDFHIKVPSIGKLPKGL